MQESWRDVIGDFAFDWSFDNISFALGPCHDDDFFSLLDCVDTHGNCCLGYIIDSLEGLWSVSSGEPVEINEPGATVDGRRWLVESDVSSPSNAKNLNINSAKRLDFLFIIFTELRHLSSFDFSVWNVDVLFGNVDMLEEIVPHVKIIWFRVVVQDGVIFIEIKSNHVLEWKSFFFVESYQLSVN